jgi:hypothetical protein
LEGLGTKYHVLTSLPAEVKTAFTVTEDEREPEGIQEPGGTLSNPDSGEVLEWVYGKDVKTE